MKKTWSPEEIAALKTHRTDKELSNVLGRSIASVKNKRQMLGVVAADVRAVAAPQTPKTVAEDIAVKDEAFWKSQHDILAKKYDKLVKEEVVVDRLVNRVLEAAPVAYSPLPPAWVGTGQNRDHGQPQSAFLMFGDTHIGKNVKPNQTLAFGCYNFRVFMARLKYLEDSVASICKNHVTTDVPELVIAMLGDMLDGTLVHSNEAGQADPIFNQFYCGAHAVAQFLRNIAPLFPKIRIYDVVGNHTRFTNQHRMPTKNRYSNFDKFFYALVRELVRDIPNINWTLDAQPYQIFEVQGFTVFTAHGDTLRGGDKTLGVPNHAVGRLVSTATQMMNKFNRKAPNYYMVGHLHRDIVLPHATGSVLVNGGFPGVDEFGLAEMFTPADPSQKFFFMHPHYGKTATYDISLKFAEVEKIAPYTMPPNFEMT